MKLKLIAFFVSLVMFSFLSGCTDNDEPEIENEEEIISQVILSFFDGTNTITAEAVDPDGEGFEDIQIIGSIQLKTNTSYSLTITLKNTLQDIDISEEVKAEADEHLFFFSFSENLFADPVGNGNVDNRSDAVNYLDEDEDGLALGLETSWETGVSATGNFRVILKHQPGIKSATSTANDGESDLDLEWPLEISE